MHTCVLRRCGAHRSRKTTPLLAAAAVSFPLRFAFVFSRRRFMILRKLSRPKDRCRIKETPQKNTAKPVRWERWLRLLLMPISGINIINYSSSTSSSTSSSNSNNNSNRFRCPRRIVSPLLLKGMICCLIGPGPVRWLGHHHFHSKWSSAFNEMLASALSYWFDPSNHQPHHLISSTGVAH